MGPMGRRTERLEDFARDEADALLALFRRSLRDAEAAQDLVQDTLLAAWRSRGSYDPDRPFRNWIFRIGINRLRNHLRRLKLENQAMRPLKLDPAGGERPTRRFADIERGERIEEAVCELPGRQREIFLLRYQEGMTCIDIADALETTPNAISIQLHHARKKLREHLGQEEPA